MAKRKRHPVRIVAAALLLAVVGALVGYGLHRASEIPLTEVRVSNITHADSADVLRLVSLPDSVRLFAVPTAEVAERAEMEPWVEKASVRRWMNGVLEIRITERRPVMLALGGDGTPAMLLDAEGRMLPPTPTALHAGLNLPLLTGSLPEIRFGEELADPTLRRLLTTIPNLDPTADALLSAIERRPDGQLVATTAPAPDGHSIPVWIGRDGFAEKFQHLVAFWDQAVLARPDHPIRHIDLRFDGQIVTDEG